MGRFPRRPPGRAGRWRTGGKRGLTTIAGALLIVLLAVIGITIIRIGQLLWLHLFVGLLLLGPIAVKMASTGQGMLPEGGQPSRVTVPHHRHDPAIWMYKGAVSSRGRKCGSDGIQGKDLQLRVRQRLERG